MIREKFEEMLDLQDKFNSVVNKQWRDESSDDYDWATCIMVEGAESIDTGLTYKHWKKQDVDIENFKTEIIDIFHFAMSQHMVKYSKSFLSNVYTAVYETTTCDEEVLDYIGLNKYLKREVKHLVLESLIYDNTDSEDNIYRQMNHLFTIVDLLEWDINDLFNNYLVKNVLNKVRQDRGYKEGTYVKMWVGSDKKLYEDNVIAFDMIKDLTPVENVSTYDNLYNNLIKWYDDMLLNQK